MYSISQFQSNKVFRYYPLYFDGLHLPCNYKYLLNPHSLPSLSMDTLHLMRYRLYLYLQTFSLECLSGTPQNMSPLLGQYPPINATLKEGRWLETLLKRIRQITRSVSPLQFFLASPARLNLIHVFLFPYCT